MVPNGELIERLSQVVDMEPLEGVRKKVACIGRDVTL
jgi:hypothetical protein